ncbi:protein translocase subunit SecF [Bacteroidetes/Chlorobi group bacterium ChocPot_Mid]|nr:MAG: protein translocase subunit SecF [Bacteroidetes/Chlorobi group bacterium ChocPot_Mid]
MQFFHGTNINFIGKRQLFFFISISLIVIGLLTAIIMKPVLGIDFTGGTELAIDFHKPIKTESIRKTFEKSGFKGTEIKSYGKENQFLIRIQTSQKAEVLVNEIVRKNYPEYNIEILKVDQIGPKIGKELGLQAVFAVLLSVIAILLYIAFRFEFVFGLGAVIALVHDVLITFSMVVIFHHLGILDLEIDQSIVAALLTVVGYSINDTVIIFDRIRENREKFKGFDFIRMTNQSINETLSRTINTVITVVLVLITLVFLGGPVLQGFAFTMLVGIITGTYSSIYIASSFVIWFMQKVKKVELKEYTGLNVEPEKA